jgi:lipid-binding SYLF domain-containing protein
MERPMLLSRRAVISGMTVSASTAIVAPWSAFAASKADNTVDKALSQLYAEAPSAKELSTRATAILVFPKITKAGLLFGGAYGEGVLRKNGADVADYNSVAASYGLQAGVQWFGYALFIMNDKALTYLDSSSGWEIGSGPSVVVVDKGAAKKFSSTTLSQDVYAYIFGQKGLMAGIGLAGTKITKIH